MNYAIFGLEVDSDRELPFPEECEDTDQVCVRLRRVTDLEERVVDDQLGHLGDRGVDLQYGGWLFRLDANSAEIAYQPRPIGQLELPFAHIVERMILPLYATIAVESNLCLHAGSVVVDGRAWLFIGDTGAGKSTTVYELMHRYDARLASDEMAVVDVDDLLVRPGAPALRLHRDKDVDGACEAGEIHPELDKKWYRFGGDRLAVGATPLAGIVLLEAEEPGADGPIAESLAGGRRLTRLLRETFEFEEKPDTWSRRRFGNAATLAKNTRMLSFRYPRSPSGEPTHVPALWEEIADPIG